MQDRVPLYPGRVTLTPVAGQENTFDMVRADEPTQPGTPLNKATLLKDVTASILGLPNTAVPDDAFLALTIGVGTYGFRVKIQLADGTPVEGATVSGIEALTGSTLVSGADGIVLGKSTSKTVTIGCTSPYIDQAAPTSQSVTAAGTITDVVLTLTAITGAISITSSQTVKVSPMAKTVDITAVGGGGGGGSGRGSNSKASSGGSGGGGGYANTVLGISAADSVTVTIGAGGAPSASTTSSGTSTGGTGGKTTVKLGDATVCEATGGGGGISAPYSGAATIPSGGAGNGDGGRGSGGGTYDSYAGMPGSAGSKYIFDDTSLGLAGGGGGGGGSGWGDTAELIARNAGGAPNGGKGRTATSSGTQDGSAGKVMGGGGGGGCREADGYSGGAGGVYLRFHF